MAHWLVREEENFYRYDAMDGDVWSHPDGMFITFDSNHKIVGQVSSADVQASAEFSGADPRYFDRTYTEEEVAENKRYWAEALARSKFEKFDDDPPF